MEGEAWKERYGRGAGMAKADRVEEIFRGMSSEEQIRLNEREEREGEGRYREGWHGGWEGTGCGV